jgi:hypothetical protein
VLRVLKMIFIIYRSEENAFVTPPSGDFPIPLPPPGGFDDIACLDTAPEQGPFPDPDLGTLFSSESEVQEDVTGKKELLFVTTGWQKSYQLWKFI